MALYANALSKYQNYLSGDESKKFQDVAAPEPTRDQPLGSDPSRQPAPQQPPAGAPSVPTSTNAEQTDFRNYDQEPAMGTALTGTVAPEAQSDPYADLASAYEEPAPVEPFEKSRGDFSSPAEEPPVDDLVEQALRDLLAGQRDTTEDEAMIRERNEASMTQGLADNQARMAARGFGSSGALAGIDADIRGRAEQQALDEILGVRGDAEDDWLRRVGTGLGADLTRREYASRESARDAYADLLNDLNEEGEGGEGGDGEPVTYGYTDPEQTKADGFTEVVSSVTGGSAKAPYVVHTVKNPDTGETTTVTVPYNESTGWGGY